MVEEREGHQVAGIQFPLGEYHRRDTKLELIKEQTV